MSNSGTKGNTSRGRLKGADRDNDNDGDDDAMEEEEEVDHGVRLYFVIAIVVNCRLPL